jgi:KDO2-lipid IV(A) lauroyltransferase
VRWIGDVIVAAVVAVLILPVMLLPQRAARWVARRYGDVGYAGYGLGRRTGVINVRRAFGAEMTHTRARQMTRRVFQHLAQAVAEGLWCLWPGAADAFVRSGRVTEESPEVVRQALTDPRAKMLVTAHLGSWDLAVIWARMSHGRGAVVQRTLDNRVLQAALEWARAPLGETIAKRGAAGATLDRLRNGQSVAMIVDENAGPRGAFVPFFGRAASTHRTPALLSLQTGSPIVLAVMVRRGGGRFLSRSAWFDPADTAAGWTVDSLTAALTAQLERWIRDDPEQWRWIHWRWKARPDGTQERYDTATVRAGFSEHA